MKLYHYTHDDGVTTTVKSVEQIQDYPEFKPKGFWVSDCDNSRGWFEWCQSESFALRCLNHRLIVDLDMSGVLHLSTVAQLDDFTEQYVSIKSRDSYGLHYINWSQVADAYGGVLITPYQYLRRYERPVSDWYNSWDCASGCIWDADLIRSIRIDTEWKQETSA